jgi:hypothetical protein
LFDIEAAILPPLTELPPFSPAFLDIAAAATVSARARTSCSANIGARRDCLPLILLSLPFSPTLHYFADSFICHAASFSLKIFAATLSAITSITLSPCHAFHAAAAPAKFAHRAISHCDYFLSPFRFTPADAFSQSIFAGFRHYFTPL